MKRAEEPKRISDVPARIGPFFYIKNTLIYNACQKPSIRRKIIRRFGGFLFLDLAKICSSIRQKTLALF